MVSAVINSALESRMLPEEWTSHVHTLETRRVGDVTSVESSSKL